VLTDDPAFDNAPAWSPDGARIAFATNRGAGGTDEIFVMSADGSAEANLTNNSAHDFYPEWSPDGTRIAFTSGRDGNWEVYAMNADGSGAANLSANAAEDTAPDWQALPAPPPSPPAPPQPPPAAPPPAPAALTPAPTCLVPRLVGRPLRTARVRIRRAGCAVGRVRYSRSTRRRDRVVAQRPRAGARLTRGTRISLVVSRGPASSRRSG